MKKEIRVYVNRTERKEEEVHCPLYTIELSRFVNISEEDLEYLLDQFRELIQEFLVEE